MKPIRTVKTVGADIVLLDLEDPDRWELPPFHAGAHVDCHLTNGLVRSYSLCGDPDDPYRYQIAVKREEAGRGGSIHMHDEVKLGSPIDISLPRCTFPVAEGAPAHIFIAGGIGVTPFLAMAARLDKVRGEYMLHLFHRGEMPLSEALAHCRDSGRLSVYRSDLGSTRPELTDLLGEPRPGVHVYCCGPERMIAAFEAATFAWPEDQVHVEHFMPPARVIDGNTNAYTLVLARSGKQVRVPEGGSALDAIRSLDVYVDASCEGGICGACRVHWLEGPPIHRDLILTEAERSLDVMVCVCSSAGDQLVLDL
jgi:ferredoxin-NADP reductase